MSENFDVQIEKLKSSAKQTQLTKDSPFFFEETVKKPENDIPGPNPVEWIFAHKVTMSIAALAVAVISGLMLVWR